MNMTQFLFSIHSYRICSHADDEAGRFGGMLSRSMDRGKMSACTASSSQLEDAGRLFSFGRPIGEW